ncbi:MAG: efflux RND transporter periplasmic adaptor subunit [Saprospiraceae bacterium]
MDRQITIENQEVEQRRNWGRVVLVGICIAAAVFALRYFLKPTVTDKSFVTARIEKGTVENAITASGLVVPAFEEQVNAPIATQIKEVYLPSGTEVKAGDKILELNQEFIKLQYESIEDRLELRRNNITKLKLEYDKNLNDLKYQDEIKGLQIAGMEASLQDAKRLQKIGGSTAEEVERADLQLQIAQLEKKQLENELQYRQSVVTSDRRNLELELEIEEKELRQLRKRLNETTVTAPRAGVVTWVNENIGQQVNEGEALARIANLDRFRIEGNASDRYSDQIQVGMPVRIRAGKVNLTGQITTILPAVENNTVAFIIEPAGEAEELLKPNMRVEVFVITGLKENVLRVKNGAGFRGATEQYVFAVNGENAERRTIQFGLNNRDFVEITGGNIQEGETLIISDMQDYEHLETVKL